MPRFTPLRLSLLAALGTAGCEASVEVAPTGGADAGGAGNAGGAQVGLGGTGGGGASASGGAQPVSIECEAPEPILSASGNDTGYVRCADGAIDRVAEVPCEDPYPWQPSCDGSEPVITCETDADCIDHAYGRCAHLADEAQGSVICGCSYGCATDTDCTGKFEGATCLCSGIVEEPLALTCAPTACRSGSDCASGTCGLVDWHDDCGHKVHLMCRSERDTCHSDLDCLALPGTFCGGTFGEETFACREPGCIPGRPMVVGGVARTAQPSERADWAAQASAPGPAADPVRAALAAQWATTAAFEHASVASFARFTLQLLALGAPAELVADAQRAALDEVEHARLAYGLASAFAGRSIGPGPLSESTAPITSTPAEVVRALVLEGCIGETLGVAEVLVVGDACREPAIAAVLRTIAADEERHAALAWRSLAWMVARNEALVEVALVAFAEADASLASPPLALVSPAHGLLAPRDIAAARRQALREVVEPCCREVLGQARPHAGRRGSLTSSAQRAHEV